MAEKDCKICRRDRAIEELKRTFPGIEGICASEDLGWNPGGIHLGNAAEGGHIDGVAACNPNWCDYDISELIWVGGVHRKLEELLDHLGFFAEPYDPGTWLAWES